MAENVPYFELHIRPMFRRLDRDHMAAFKLDLWSYEDMSTHAKRIAKFLRRPPPQTMPTKATGGPWPEGWIQVFEQWAAEGCPRLSLTRGKYSAQRIGNGQIILSVAVQLDNGAEEAWVEREASPDGVAAFTLYLRPPPKGATQPPRLTQHKEVIKDTAVAEVIITDIDGAHAVTITS